MSKQEYEIAYAGKTELEDVLREYHYLSNISKGFKSGVNFSLNYRGEVVGACIFTGWPVPELAVGCFGLSREEQDGLWELSRLVLKPEHQSREHNLASWFVSRALRKLKADFYCRAVLSYADDDYHSGTVYAALNFSYYGLTASKKDFWVKKSDGSYVKHSRGPMSHLEGEWRYRSRKHRFLLTFDKELRCRWEEQKWAPR